MPLAFVLLPVLLTGAPQDKQAAEARPKSIPAAGMLAPSPTPPKPLRKGEKAAETRLTLDPKGANDEVHRAAMLMRFPNPIRLSTERPAAVVKEPRYVGTPRYALITLGSGPKADLAAVFDESDDQALLYIDANRDGDLTNDPKVAWASIKPFKIEKTGESGTVLSGTFSIPARWASGEGDYRLTFLRTKGRDVLTTFRESARTGKLTVAGKTYEVRLAENAGTGVFDNDKAIRNRRPPVWLLIDLDGNGNFKPSPSGREVLDTTRPLPIGNEFYAAEFSEDGSTLTLYKTDAPPKVETPPRRRLLQVGQKAPDFKFLLADGRSAKFSDYRGKIRVLDMWATWCGPCVAAMPKVESMHRQVKDQDVFVLGLCVMDERESYDRWIEKNRGKTYHFNFGYDEAGRDHASGGISNDWGVYAIPTTFVVDRDDTILAVIQGFTPANHEKVIKALNDKGIKVEIETTEKAETR